MRFDRRNFIKAAGAAAGAGVFETNAQAAESGGFDWHLRDEALEKTLGRASAMDGELKVRRIETFTRGSLSIVRLTADNGAVGVGQISPFDADISATVLHRKIAPFFLGKSVSDISGGVDRCIEGNYKYPWSFVCRALTGVETALWDLIGKVKGKSVCELLGGRPRAIATYGSSMQRQITPADEAARLVKLRDEKGYRAFKIRIGSVCGHDKDQWPGRTEELVRAVRKAIGDEVDLLVDGNSCYTPRRAIEVGKLLADNNVCHFEEPCPYWELEWTAQVARAISVPVAGGEQDNDLAQWRRMITLRAVDIVQPDVCYIGGLTRALWVAALAHRRGMPCVPHSANRSMVTVFALHMLGAIPNRDSRLEFSIEDTSWTDDLFVEPLEAVDGCVMIPLGPGWGVTVRPDWLEKAQRQESA